MERSKEATGCPFQWITQNVQHERDCPPSDRVAWGTKPTGGDELIDEALQLLRRMGHHSVRLQDPVDEILGMGPRLIQLEQEGRARLEKLLPGVVDWQLRVQRDPRREDDATLLSVFFTTADVEEVAGAISEFEEEWWLDHHDPNLVFDVRFK